MLSSLIDAETRARQMGTNVLLFGGSAREHALGWGIAQSRGVEMGKLFFTPGNAGTAEIGENVSWWNPKHTLKSQLWFLRRMLEEKEIGFVIVGPEAPLAEGLADAIREMGIPVFGFGARAAKLEASKGFAKTAAHNAWVPMGRYETFDCDAWQDAITFVEKRLGVQVPVVVKVDGLAGGTGVFVPRSLVETQDVIRRIGKEGCAGGRFVVEEQFSGQELSPHVLVSGGTHHMLPVLVADEKRATDAPDAPNTGGMGAYGPVPWVDHETRVLYEELFVRRVLSYCRNVLGIKPEELHGCLYPGIMETIGQGPKLLEYNARFGNPEAQILMRLWKNANFGSPLTVLEACARGTYTPHIMGPYWTSGNAVCVNLAARGYPGDVSAVQGAPIRGIKEAEEVPGVVVFHGGTTLNDEGELVVSGGRILSVTAVADTFREARKRAYEAIARIAVGNKGDNLTFYRKDIGLKAEKWQKMTVTERAVMGAPEL